MSPAHVTAPQGPGGTEGRVVSIPARLQALRQWLVYRRVPKENEPGKFDKVPYYITGKKRHGTQGSKEDRTKLAAFDDAVREMERGRYDGVGLAMLPEAYLVGVDLDNCIGEDGKRTPIAEEFLRDDTYAEVSPSGHGLRLFYAGAGVPDKKNHDLNVEVFHAKGFLTVTGNRVNGEDILPMSAERRARLLELVTKPRSGAGPAPGEKAQHSHSLEQIEKALSFLRPDDREKWLLYGWAIARGTSWSQEGFDIWLAWSARSGKHDPERDPASMRREFFEVSREPRDDAVTLGTLFHDARQAGYRDGEVSTNDFYAYMPMHNYLFVPTREPWPASSVNSRIPKIDTGRLDDKQEKIFISASAWLDEHRAVEQMTWCPGEPMLIKDRLITGGGWLSRPGCATFNLYLPPVVAAGNPRQAERWLDHVYRVFGDDADHIIKWLAHRVQRPEEKPNHALVLSGKQGIGKDALLEPVKYAVGPWNFADVLPTHLLGRFNSFVKSVILRVSEARDLGEAGRYGFYDHMKAYTAAPPDVLRCDEKNIREFPVVNVCGVVITTNYKDGIYLPPDDRRHFVAWSERDRAEFEESYWTDLYHWFASGGNAHVAAYLAKLDLSSFDAKAPPPKTPAFWDVVDSSRAPEDAELADAIDEIGKPPALTLSRLVDRASGNFQQWLLDRSNRRQIPHRLEAVGYTPVRNPHADDGLWKVFGKRQAIYAWSSLPPRDRLAAAAELTR